ncbi:hypothetical protein GCM10025859_11510 [Alicyclobacillus fastidiosus]|nr:hypothetical protein GCM10025859_11510 [Alicyclobacillus fastidiosus]
MIWEWKGLGRPRDRPDGHPLTASSTSRILKHFRTNIEGCDLARPTFCHGTRRGAIAAAEIENLGSIGNGYAVHPNRRQIPTTRVGVGDAKPR